MSKPGWLSENDPNSYSNTHDVIVSQLLLELDVDFKKQILKGSATWTVLKKNKAATKIILDTRDLKIDRVTDGASTSPLSFSLGESTKAFGSKLEINLPSGDDKCAVRIDYETAPTSSALQWLKPQQTAGKRHPYLFSQCQAIHCRSMVPCQDSPTVKFPYTAKISAPNDIVILMSAVKQGVEPCASDTNKSYHSFHQKVPIPSYLLAIVGGALESREIGPRSKVWSEREMVDAAAKEFSETEVMLSKAEELMGPYVWGVYDLLVLPPSFPYGGMENPCLTFVTPTLLAGDKSLACVVAHEIAHSWMGNLITPSNWEHFWLNEGNTVFIERKILGRMNNERHRHLSAISGWKDLQYQVEEVFGSDNPYTHLVPDMKGVDPDDAFSSTPYEKGSSLLMYLEQLLGGPGVFEKFIKAYVEKFKYKSITTKDWKEFLFEYFKSKDSLLKKVDWNTWFNKPGMPPVKPNFDDTLGRACTSLAERWSHCKEDHVLQEFCEDDISDMSPRQLQVFLGQLIEMSPFPKKKLAKMEEVYRFSVLKNSEIRFRWLRLCLRARIKEAIEPSLEFVNEQGRMKFVRPIYRDLYNWEEARSSAVQNYKLQSIYMHSLTANMVGKDLKLIS